MATHCDAHGAAATAILTPVARAVSLPAAIGLERRRRRFRTGRGSKVSTSSVPNGKGVQGSWTFFRWENPEIPAGP